MGGRLRGGPEVELGLGGIDLGHVSIGLTGPVSKSWIPSMISNFHSIVVVAWIG